VKDLLEKAHQQYQESQKKRKRLINPTSGGCGELVAVQV
jgi:hypothetical protein